MGLLVNIDNGGSFTDAFATDGDRVAHVKSPTTPHDLTHCFVTTLERLSRELYGEDDLPRLLGETEHLRYSTTSGTNAVVEHKGVPVGLVVESGQEAALYGAGSRLTATALWPAMVPNPPTGLSFAGGKLDELELIDRFNRMISHGVSRIVVALTTPDLEREVKDAVLERYPRHLLGAIPVLFSHELVRDADHGRRLLSAVVNSYLHPGMEHFLYGADRVTRQHHLGKPLLIYRNDGDSARVAKTAAIKTYGSGPRGGMAGGVAYADHYRSALMVAMDIGGTTMDISMVVDGKPTLLGHGLVGDEEIPCSFPMGDILSIGYGGSSIFRLDGEAMLIGPDSVGAAPGPACFGRGGDHPTITDALLLAGVIDGDRYLGGELRLDKSLAEDVIGKYIGVPLGITVVEAVKRMIQTYEQQVARQVVEILASRKLSATDADLLAFGGGGPMNACGIAEAAGFRRVIVPAYASVFSAYGIGFSDLSHQYRVPAAEVAARGADAVLADMRVRATRDLYGEGVEAGDWRELVEVWGTVADREIRRPYTGGDLGAIGAGLDDVGLQLTAIHDLRHLSLKPAGELPAATAAATGMALVSLGDESATLPVYSLKAAAAGGVGQGPALFRDDYLTCPVLAGWSYRVTANGDLILERQQ
ncbi:MAG: hydantoinase/oxoprolinase family protein [Porticoccaceae bacterium]